MLVKRSYFCAKAAVARLFPEVPIDSFPPNPNRYPTRILITITLDAPNHHADLSASHCPSRAFAQSGGSPFDTGFTAMQTLFTGTVAKVASLIAIVVGGYQFAHGEPGAKKTLAGVAAGTGIAVLATNVLTWLWGM